LQSIRGQELERKMEFGSKALIFHLVKIRPLIITLILKGNSSRLKMAGREPSP